MKSPSREKCGDDEFVKFLDVVTRDVVGVNDLVHGEQSRVVCCRQVGVYRRCQDVVVIVQHG